MKITTSLKMGAVLAVGLYLHLQYWVIALLVFYTLLTLVRWFPLANRGESRTKPYFGHLPALRLFQINGPFLQSPWAVRLILRFTAVVLVILIFTGFVGAAYGVPSGSMVPTIVEGDYLWCDKLAYGTEVKSETPQFLLRLIFRPSPIFTVNKPLHSSRLFSFSKIQKNDIVIFKSPSREDETMVKRFVGLPGDTIEIRRGVVLINARPLPLIPGQIPDTDNMAPEQVPYKGMNIELTRHNIQLYRKVMEIYENGYPFEAGSPGGKLVTYTFLQDYYIALGDNRPGSLDSRSWGLVPESCIIGRTSFVLFSAALNERRALFHVH